MNGELSALRAVADAARRIRHWHDSDNAGMVVSGESVRALWSALDALDAYTISELEIAGQQRASAAALDALVTAADRSAVAR